MSGIFNTELHFALIYILNGCMSQSKRETKEDQMPSMDPPARRPSDDGEGESPAGRLLSSSPDTTSVNEVYS